MKPSRGSYATAGIVLCLLLFGWAASLSAQEKKGPSYGPENAPVSVYLYYDFQCGHCGKTAPVLYDVIKQYDNLVRLVTINVPGPGHAYALPCAEFALTAAEYGKFWEAFELLFQNQDKLAEDNLLEYAGQIGLDPAVVKKNLNDKTHMASIKKDFYGALEMGLTATPTIFVEETMLVGAQTADSLKWHLNQALEAKGIKSPVGPVAKPEEKKSEPIKEVPQEMIFQVPTMKPQDSRMHLKVGDKAPDFSLPTIDGGTVTLGDFLGKKNLVLSFVPAAWTPVCSAQWPEYNENEEVFKAADAGLVGISVDNVPSLYSWTGTMGPIWFFIASDFYPHGKAADAYGILRPNGVSERAVFLIDKQGVIRYINVHDINSKPSFKELTEALDKLK